jgi:hypothetical protein
MNRPYITVVTGMARTGTSLVMQMLVEAGIPPVVDYLHKFNENNPKGFWEHSKFALAPVADTQLMDFAVGKCVKVTLMRVRMLNTDYDYKFINARRDPAEIAMSANAVHQRNKVDIPIITAKQMAYHRKKYEPAFYRWCINNAYPVLNIEHRRLINQPEKEVRKITDFLGLDESEIPRMVNVVDPDLYRARKRK